MKLYAISDLHLGHPKNRHALAQLSDHPNDWLIVAGDIGEKIAHFRYAFDILTTRFAKVIWVPGNHDLWTLPKAEYPLRGVEKYAFLVDLCREYGVLTPEDPYVVWQGDDLAATLVPMCVWYDYSFRPKHLSKLAALAAAEANNIVCTDEIVLHVDPFPSIEAWCADRLRYTEQRLAQLPPNQPLIAINHYPLREDLAVLPRIPQFTLWCGTTQTERWLTRYPIRTVVYGHLHIRRTVVRDGVCHEEVSLGYPRQWDQTRSIDSYLREIRIM